MPAERFRAWRIRSPSWRNELIKKRHSSKSPATLPGFFLLYRFAQSLLCVICRASVFLLDAIFPHLKHGAPREKSSQPAIEMEQRSVLEERTVGRGYPEKESRKASRR
jgi:hypothetical protein